MWFTLSIAAVAGPVVAVHAPDVRVDGTLEPTAWGRAPWVTLGQPWHDGTPSTSAGAALVWTDRALCLAARVEDRDLVADLTAHDAKTWRNDAIELFVVRGPDAPVYYEFHITPRATLLDIELPRGGGTYEDHAHTRPFHQVGAARVQGTLNPGDVDRGWVAELCVPWADMGGPPRDGDAWTVLIARYDHTPGRQPELSSTGRLSALSFHRVDEYDPLQLVE